MALLRQMPDINTLSALIHASPIFHAVYLANREDILTKATLRELSTKNQSLNLDELLQPASLCHLVTKNRKLDRNLEPAIKACHAQANSATDIKLSVDQCIALRNLLFYYSWQIEESYLSTPYIHIVACPTSDITYKGWSHPIRACFMHILPLDNERVPDEMCRLKDRGPGGGGDPVVVVNTRCCSASRPIRRGGIWISAAGRPMTWSACEAEDQDLWMLYAAHRCPSGA